MKDTAFAKMSTAYPSLAAQTTAEPSSAAVVTWQKGPACSPRANVAYSFLHTLDWVRSTLRRLLVRSARRSSHLSAAGLSVLRGQTKLT